VKEALSPSGRLKVTKNINTLEGLPLSGVQEAILQRLGLGTNLYQQLEIQNIEK
jgi:hypothetical protein